MDKRTYYVVFNNDAPLSVCLTEEQGLRERNLQREQEGVRLRQQFGKRWELELRRYYFHVHEVRAAQVPLVVLTAAELGALQSVAETDGMEVVEHMWPTYERLAAKLLITLSGARGPGGAWRRAELTELGKVVLHG